MGVHSLEEEEGGVGRLQVIQEAGEVVVAVVDHYLGVAEGAAAAVALLCCPVEGEEEVVVVPSDPGGVEVEGVGEEVATEVPQPSGSARWRPC